MNFYRRRPLALAISLCFAVSAAAVFVPGAVKVVFMILAAVLAPIIIKILRRYGVREVCGLASTPFVLISAALLMSFILTSFAYYDVYAAKYEKLDSGEITAVVTQVKSSRPYGATYVVRLKDVDGKAMNARGFVRTGHSMYLSPGDVVKGDVVFFDLGDLYKPYDVSRYDILADGILFSCDTVEPLEVVGSFVNAEVFFNNLKVHFMEKMSLYLDEDSAAFANALFLGVRDGMGVLRRDFTTAGIAHVLALSGMHLTILSGFIDKIFGFIGIGGKFKSIPIILFVLFYAALTGFLMSVMRAAVMLILVQVAVIFDSNADRITALFAACGLIVLVNPAALYDVSLQLSFFATLGVLLFVQANNDFSGKISRTGAFKQVRKYIIRLTGNISASLGATLFVLPLQWLYFGEISMLGIPATLIVSAICDGLLMLYPIYLLCSLSDLQFICPILGRLIELLTHLTAETVSFIAGLMPPLSLKYPFVLPIIVCLAAVIILMMYKNCRSWYSTLIPICIAVVIYFGGVRLYDHIHYHEATLDFNSYNSNDAVLAVSNRKAMIIDVGNGAGTTLGLFGNYLDERYITYVDSLVLTRPASRHISALSSFFEYNIVKRIYVPMPQTDDEYYIIQNISAVAEEFGTELITYTRSGETNMLFGDLLITLAESESINRSAVPLDAIRFSKDDSEVTYIGRAAWESERLWHFANSSDFIVFGSHGPKYRDPPGSAVSSEVLAVHLPDDDYFDFMKDTLSGFGGSVSVGSRYSVLID